MFGKIMAIGASCILLTTAVNAETFEIQMLNKGENGAMVFEPAFVAAALGDTITFVSSSKGHNAESIKGMLPEGAEPFKSKLSKDFSITLDQEGLYGVKCTPHYTLGMVALIQVGAAINLDEAAAVKQKGKAKKRFIPLFEQVQE